MKKEYIEPLVDIIIIDDDILTISDPSQNYPWSFEEEGFEFK